MPTGKANINVIRVMSGLAKGAPVLRFSGEGSAVKQLQTRLTRAGFMVPVTGKFLDLTQRAVMNFQQKNNLPSSGIVDKLTYEKLQERLKDKPNYNLLYWEGSLTPKESQEANLKEVDSVLRRDKNKKLLIISGSLLVIGLVMLARK